MCADSVLGGSQKTKPTLLLVDDEPGTLRFLGSLLSDEYRLKLAKSGEQALELVKAQPIPDLILLDVMMPDIDGYEVCRRIKADPATSQIPVIFVTGAHDEESESKGLQLGAVDYIHKPINASVSKLRISQQLTLSAYQERLRERDGHLRAIEETTTDGVITADINGMVIDVNQSYEKLSGYPRDELIGMSLSQLEPGLEFSGTQHGVQQLLARSETPIAECLHRRRDGSLWPAECSTTFVPGERGLVIMFLRDISERKRRIRFAHEKSMVLDMLARGAPVNSVLERIVGDFEMQSENNGYLCTVLINENDRSSGHVVGASSSVGIPLSQLNERLVPCSTNFCGASGGEFRGSAEQLSCRSHAQLVNRGVQVCHISRMGDAVGNKLGCIALQAQPELAKLPISEAVLENFEHATEMAALAVERSQISEAQALAALVYDTSSEAIIVCDRQKKIVAVNPAFTEQTGYKIEDLKAKSEANVLEHVLGRTEYEALVAHMDRHSTWQQQLTMLNAEGGSYPALFTIKASRSKFGVVTHYVATVSDLSLYEAAKSAEAASAAKSEFLASMSHEIRTPMSGVMGMLDLLQRSELNRRQRTMIDTIRTSASSLIEILNGILDLSKIEAGKLEIDLENVNLREAVEDVGDVLAGAAADKAMDLHVYVDPSLPRLIVSDHLRLRQILLNMVNNAIKFTHTSDDERGTISVRAQLVNGKNAGAEILRISVEDNGIGMSEEVVKAFFNLFNRQMQVPRATLVVPALV